MIKKKVLIKNNKFSPILDKMAGSLVLPKRYKGMKLDKIIEESKKEYFRRVV